MINVDVDVIDDISARLNVDLTGSLARANSFFGSVVLERHLECQNVSQVVGLWVEREEGKVLGNDGIVKMWLHSPTT